uniref:Uncharacterized protein n=1 Tax=Physcomitrium patens TaxID=3218 RepID=A0A2K1KC92_PHYPA|nr:hypothetical protein PHYPA_010582 [Physcomitrium patens]
MLCLSIDFVYWWMIPLDPVIGLVLRTEPKFDMQGTCTFLYSVLKRMEFKRISSTMLRTWKISIMGLPMPSSTILLQHRGELLLGAKGCTLTF